ncbi:SipW-dependent-type signal peptide-containing protein [Clostridium ganghwense]|uniref:SipW-dependent-type signal peptide-containing protein n=1 Tax=Clostridium ganghwense TaxID=312089 RepID=A0ABT4CQP3_9CLOT|nr:SipW-dependent-type signal peptide-containing protein [Clostridium ganghwense]MCY6371367.1 SipW-dependent-type signal peptide-containing protein [Clostridium ganghwense]
MKKTILGLLLAGVLAFGVGMGTTAYYSSEVESTNNIIHAAKWDINAGDFQTTAGFNFNGEKEIYPGCEITSNSVTITNNNTNTNLSADYVFTVNLQDNNTLNKLINEQSSPAELYVVYNGIEKKLEFGGANTAQVEFDNISINESRTCSLKLKWGFGNNDDDNVYNDKDITIDIKFVAKQHQI